MDGARLYRHRLRNLAQTLLLLAAMAGLCGYLAWLVGGEGLLWLALAFVGVGYLLNPALSPGLMLRLYHGRLIAPHTAPLLYELLDRLADRAGLEHRPRLYYIPSDVMNAFAVGEGDGAVIALSDGLLRRLDLGEIAGVLAHDVSHIRHRDLKVMGLADLMGRLTSLLSLLGQVLLLLNLPLLLFGDFHIAWLPILLLLAAPTLNALAQLALSRNREYDADLGAAELAGDPLALASALEKMEAYQGRVLEQLLFPGQRLPDPSLLRTHPPTRERIRRLVELERREDWASRFVPLTRSGVHGLGFLAQQPLRPRWRRSGLWY